MAIEPDTKLARHEEIILQKESKSRRNFIRRIIDEITYPSVYTVIRYLDLVQRFKSYFHKHKVEVFKNYKPGQKIALVAIWEYQTIRKDIEKLLQELIKRDFYICLVNTGFMEVDKVKNVSAVYIERYNYGRDFGSYKLGIQYLQEDDRLSEAEKFLLLNDSVYYLQNQIGQTLDKFLESDLEVIGATENFEIVHHLGSFFIQFSNRAVNSKEFKKFWKKFKVTDVRTKNIRYGEMKLTEKLKKAVPEDKLGAIWSLSYMSREFNNFSKLSKAIELVNRGHVTSWKKLSWQFITKSFLDERIIFLNDLSKKQGVFLGGNQEKTSVTNQIDLIMEYQDALKMIHKVFDKELYDENLSDLYMKAKGLWISTTASGSQIHQNNNLLVYLGCPLVKLDLIYRGAFSYEDAEIMFSQIENPQDAELLREILYRRAYGLEVLRGWKRSAFNKGLI